MMRARTLLATLLAMCTMACSHSDTLYCSIPARLVMSNVYVAPALYTACNSLGEFCTATMDAQKVYFQGSKETSQVNRTALGSYDGIVLGLGGLIIGLPSLPEVGKDVSQVVCYDLHCPNCYEQNGGVTKRLEGITSGTARCKGCGRSYDLNSQGIVSQGETGRPLFRYRASYVGTALVVSNR